MPLSVLEAIEVDYCVGLAEMGNLLLEITQVLPEEHPVPNDILIESQIAERVVVNYDNITQLGEKSIYACPDCGGGLWAISTTVEGQQNITRYRCHIGHSYSEKDLLIKQGEKFESTLWVALRIMEERRNLLKKMADENSSRGFSTTAETYREKEEGVQVHINKMKELLFASQKQ